MWKNVTIESAQSRHYDRDGNPMFLFRVIADFNGIIFRADEHSSRIAAVVDAKKAFPGWKDE